MALKTPIQEMLGSNYSPNKIILIWKKKKKKKNEVPNYTAEITNNCFAVFSAMTPSTLFLGFLPALDGCLQERHPERRTSTKLSPSFFFFFYELI